jgi:hypothetical protein
MSKEMESCSVAGQRRACGEDKKKKNLFTDFSNKHI